jgi:hypothetical protein
MEKRYPGMNYNLKKYITKFRMNYHNYNPGELKDLGD